MPLTPGGETNAGKWAPQRVVLTEEEKSLSAKELAKKYGVNRATAFRWLAAGSRAVYPTNRRPRGNKGGAFVLPKIETCKQIKPLLTAQLNLLQKGSTKMEDKLVSGGSQTELGKKLEYFVFFVSKSVSQKSVAKVRQLIFCLADEISRQVLQNLANGKKQGDGIMALAASVTQKKQALFAGGLVSNKGVNKSLLRKVYHACQAWEKN